MIDAELQGRVHRTHVKALQSVFFVPVSAAPQQGRSAEPSHGDAVAAVHVCVTPLPPPTPASKFTTGIKASELFQNAAPSVRGGGDRPGAPHLGKHHARQGALRNRQFVGIGEDNYVSAPLRSFFLTSHLFRHTRVKAGESKLRGS